MSRLTLMSLLLGIAVMACVPLHPDKPGIRDIQPVASSGMDEEFLYLAALEATHAGRPDLAIRLLTSLLEKDPQASTPRLLLAELLVSRKNLDGALDQVQTVMENPETPEGTRLDALGLRSRIHYFSGMHEEALSDIESILELRPEVLSVRMQHIELLDGMGRLDDAHASIAEALEIQPNAHVYRIAAQLFIKQDELDQANAMLEQARALTPQDESLVLMQSELAIQRNNPAGAEKILRDFIDENPMALQAANAIGRLLINQKRFDQAVAIYESLAEKTNRHHEIMTALGLLHYQREDYATAATYFRQALESKSSRDDVRFYLAACLEATGKAGEAEGLYSEVGTESREYAGAQLRLALLEFEGDRLGQAADRLKKLIGIHQEMIDAHVMLSSVRLRQKNYGLLIKESEEVIGLRPIDLRLLFNRAIAFESLKKFDRLELSLKQLLDIEPDHAEALNFLGYSLADRNVRLQESEKLIRKALSLDAGNGYYLDSLAWVLYRQEKYSQALEIQQQAIAVIADDPVMHDHLGDMFWKAGDAKQARQSWKHAIDLKHEQPDLLRKKIGQGLGDL